MYDIESHRLDNGLTLHIAAGHPAPVTAIQAWVGVGSADEPDSQAGLAHVIEHMLFKGGPGNGVGALARSIARAGGEVNAWTSFDHTVVHAVVASSHVDDAIEALAAAFTATRVDPDELAREREVILEEIRSGSDDPARSVTQSLFATAYAVHPYRRPVIGTAETVRGLRAAELVGFFRSHYVAGNTTLVVVGDVEAEQICRTIARKFASMPMGSRPRRLIAEPAQTAPRAAATVRDVSEAYIAVGFRVPPARHPDIAVLDVISSLLAENESARLQRRLRDDAQLVTTTYAHTYALRDPGLFVLSATTRPQQAEMAVSALVEQTLALLDDVSADELDKARSAAKSSFVRQLETAQGRAQLVGWNATVAGDPRFAHVYLDRARSVRRHDIADVVRRYVRGDNATVAAVLPESRRASRAKTFARGAETRMARLPGRARNAEQRLEKRVVLPNGMVVLVRRDSSVPIIAMRAVWRGGQRVESEREAGASALLSRLITRGCRNRDAGAFADRIDHLGGSIAGSSGRNSFGLAAEWLTSSWPEGFDITADCLVAPSLAAAEVENEKRILFEDQEAKADNPTQVAFRLFSEALYRDHPYHRDGLGTPASIRALGRVQLTKFYRSQYPVAKLTLSIVGDVDPDDAIARAQERFGTAPTRKPSKIKVIAPTFDHRPMSDRAVYCTLNRSQAHFVVGFPGATIDAADRFALEILIAILGGHSGRLFVELRGKRGLVYRVSAHSVEGIDPGFVAIYTACSPEKLGAAIAQVQHELDHVRSNAVSSDELERAQSYLVGTHHIAMQRRSAVASALAYHEAYGLGWQTWRNYESAIRSVTIADICAAANRYLDPQREITATVRPPPHPDGTKSRRRNRP